MSNGNDEDNWIVKYLKSSIVVVFANMWTDAWSGFVSFLDDIIFSIANGLTRWMAGAEKNQWGAMLDMFVAPGLIDEDTAKELMKFKDLPTPIDQLMFLRTLFSLTSSYTDLKLYGASTDMRHAIYSESSPELPRPEEVMAAAFIAPEKIGEVREVLKQSGFSEAHIDLLFLSLYRLYDENMIRDLYLRGVLNENQMFMRMRELGYTDTRIKEIIQSWSLIPGPTDILHMVAKEAFEPDMVQKMGLEDEFPGSQVDWLKKQGLSEFWAMKYWAAHWEMPSIQAGYEMLHRQDIDRPGQSIIDHSELDMLFKTVEIPPYWRDKLTKIAFLPYTRVDVRRMHDMGVVSDEELIWAYKDLGYDDEHALGMAKFTIRYNKQNDKELTKSNIMTGFLEKVISRQDALDLLVSIDFPLDQAEYLIILEEYKEARSYQNDMIDSIKIRYQNNFLNEFECRAKLNQLNLPAEQTAILMDKWKLKKMIDVKLPSKTDLDKFIKNGIITVDQYRIEMDKLGYNFKYTDWFEKLAVMKGAK